MIRAGDEISKKGQLACLPVKATKNEKVCQKAMLEMQYGLLAVACPADTTELKSAFILHILQISDTIYQNGIWLHMHHPVVPLGVYRCHLEASAHQAYRPGTS